MASAVLEHLSEVCEVMLARNVSLWTSDGGILAPDATILGELCLNECQQRGQCVNGQSTEFYRLRFETIYQ